MGSRARLNIALLGGLAVIAGLFYLSLSERGGGDPLLEQPLASIQTLRVEAEGLTQWQAVQVDGEWQLIKPIAAPLHPERMGRLVSLLRLPVHGRYALEDVDPVRFGLDAPHLAIHVDGTEITVGDAEPVNRRRYLAMNEEVLLLDEVFFFQFDRQVESIIDRRLLRSEAPIEAIEFPQGRLARDESGAWALEGDTRLSATDLSQLLSNWRQAEAASVLAWTDTAEADEVPSVTVHLANGELAHFRIIESESALVLANPETGLRYRFPLEQKNALLPDA
ncbi:hypothetical protein J2T60_002564 [Natronospira proteinivora]|uniref:DUF4340 domain-containing protein n=1 Tax=Natronospira proteinivora TaxID=1807133 RepID=A0ABT1GB50_9GAMM|nr:DUF4340 domain-containing protein [Natronospira proteinivora]MCP1728550.1 hypothetical protein [Natronospira proteinivora]